MRRGLLIAMMMTLALLPPAAFAGDPETPPGPPEAGSSMPTLQELSDYLTTGAPPTDSASFEEPSAGPAPTMKTLKEIYEDFKSLIAQSTVTPEQVLSGQTFFSAAGTWGPAEGTMTDNGAVSITPGTSNQAIAAGYHNGSGNVVGDADLVAANIKEGVTIFGVTGAYKAESPCSGVLSSGGRWCTNNDGTVTDMTTGLIWLQDVTCWYDCLSSFLGICTSWELSTFKWDEANDKVGELASGQCGLTDGSWQGTWRLPTWDELYSLAYGSEGITRSWPGPFSDVQRDYYWTSTIYYLEDIYYILSFADLWDPIANQNWGERFINSLYVWPVRGVQ